MILFLHTTIGGNTTIESHISATRCLSVCLAEQCTSVELTQDDSVCRVYRGGHLYRVPLDKNIIPDENYIVYQHKGIKYGIFSRVCLYGIPNEISPLVHVFLLYLQSVSKP